MQTEHNKATDKVESIVSEKTKQETDSQRPDKWRWVEAAVWTERMLTALVNGVKGGKWFSLMDNILDHQYWTNAYFASTGLFTMYEAHAEASRSR